MLRIGVDIGGTFTDFALHDATGASIAIHKQLTTPDDPSRSVIEGVAALCRSSIFRVLRRFLLIRLKAASQLRFSCSSTWGLPAH